MLRDTDRGPGSIDLGSSLLGGTQTRIDAEQLDAGWGSDLVVHDAHLLFQGEYSRVGLDLVIRDGSSQLTVHDYFRPGRRPNLVSEEGASLSGEVVEALALSSHGPRYAQAGTAPAAATIGRVETVGGTASVIRNGSAVALNVGDLVYRGDVVQTGGGSSLGITFIDGTAFSLLSGARMVLNDMVYSPGGTGNSALISLVQGSISFVAGQVAKTGDMRVDTPVATMGIRGTAVNVDISADNGTTRFSVMREPDGRVGSYVLYSKTDPSTVLATVSQVDVGVVIAPNGSVTTFTKSAGDLGAEQFIVQFVFQLFNAGQANPILVTPAPAPAPPPGGPQGGGGGGSSTPPDGAVGNGSSGPASPQLPAPVNPPRPDGGAAGPTGPGASPPGAPSPGNGGGGGGTNQQTSNTTGGSVAGGSGDVVATGILTSPPGQGSGTFEVAPTPTGQAAQTGSGQTGATAHLTPKTVSVAADSLVLASGSRDGVLAREGASDASIATEQVVSAHGAAGNEVAVGPDPSTVTGTYGTLAIRSDGSYSYLALRATALAQGESGDDVFTFTVREADGSQATSTLTFHVEGVNDAPSAAADSPTVAQGAGVAGATRATGLLANDTDPDHGETDGLVLVSAGTGTDTVQVGGRTTLPGTYGTLTVSPDGTYSYVADHAAALAQGQSAVDVFTYTLSDPHGLTATSELRVAVIGVNDAPVATADHGAVTQGGMQGASTREAGLLANDADPDGGETALLEVASIQVASAGGAPSTDLTPTAQSYLAAGQNLVGGLGGASGFGENALAPNDDGSSGAIDITQVFGAQGLNFFGRLFTTIYVNNNGNVTFTGPSGTFVPTPIAGTASNPIIAPFWYDVDTRPGAVPPTPGGTSTGSDLVHYDLDPVNHVLTVTWDDVGYFPGGTNAPNAYQLQLVGHGGGDFDIVFRYEATNYGGSSGARAGYSAGDAASSYELPQSGDASAMTSLAGVVGNTGRVGVDIFTVRDGVASSGAVAVSGPTTIGGLYGTLTLSPDGTYGYAADHAAALAGGEHATDTFVYTVVDPFGATSQAPLSFDVTGVNDAPVAQDVGAALAEDGAATIAPAASDVDRDALTYAIVTGPAHGTVVLDSGSFRYTPAADYDGPDSFTYRANDGAADSNVATVSLTVTPVNDAPVLDLDTGAAGTGTSVEYAGPVLLAPGPVSITDPDAGATIDHVTLKLTSFGGPDIIDTLSLDAGASATYVIDAGGSDGVYVLHRQDGQAGTASDYADVLSRVVFTSGDDTTDRTVEIAVVANDGLTDGTAAVSTVSVPALPGGTNQAPQVTPSGTTTAYAFGGTPVVVDPAITVTDADSPTLDRATVRVSLDDLSAVIGDVLRITGGAGFTLDSASMSDLTFANGGVIHQSFADGTLTLTGENASPADFQAALEAVAFSTTNETQSGDRRVSFTANDGVSESYAVSDHVAVRFTPNDVFTTPRDTPLTADVPAGAGTTYAFGTPAHGSVAAADPNDPRAFTYTPAAGYSGPDSFAYTVDDGAGGTTIGHITIGVDPNQGGRFGFALASLGDLDGDGLADMSAGAPGNHDGAGLVFIGRNNGGDHQYQVQGSPGEQLGSALAGLGDVGSDGAPDLVAGAPGANGGAGAAYVVFGRADTSDTTTIMTSSLGGTSTEGFAITGARGGNHAGSSVAAAGYVNGDMIPDILVGAPDAAEGGGTAYLVYGKTDTGTVSLAAIEDGDTTNGIVVYGAAGDHLGFSVAGGGDLDADGFADLVLGAPGDGTTPGSVYVIRGAAALGNIDVADFNGFHILGAAEGDQFGYAVANVGDVNGDGYDDIAIGAPHATAGDRAEAGKVYVIYGAPDLSGIDVSNLGTRGFTISGAARGDHLGASVAFAGDVNGDGLADIVVGAPDSTNGGRPGDGSAYIVLGSGTGQNVDVGFQSTNLSGFTAEDHLGSSVSTTGDSSGSGLAGFASGAPRSYDVNSNSVNTGYYGSTAYSPPAFTVSGDASNNTLTGTDGNDIVGGQQGDDRISGLGGADVLNGGQGHDVFVFTPRDAAGRAVVTDFHPYATTPAGGERDQLEVAGFQVEVATLLANAMQVNSHDTLIMLDESHSVLLKNVLKASLTGDDFAIPAL